MTRNELEQLRTLLLEYHKDVSKAYQELNDNSLEELELSNRVSMTKMVLNDIEITLNADASYE